MDSKHYRKVSDPNYYVDFKNVKVNLKNTAPDNRYNGWPAIMADGRLATDYNDHCSKNVPVGNQYPTTQWLQHNAEKIIDYSRKHQFPITKNLDVSVIPPPAQILKTSKYDCHLEATNQNLGIGVERDNNVTPDLFGTFSQVSYEQKPKNSMVTNYYEGGRNTPRGTYSNLTSVYNLNQRNDYH